jgi:hypothetical protein
MIMGGPEGWYPLQAGTLAEDEPIVDLEVPWRAEVGEGIARQPAIGAPHGGSVVYVADDGTGSEIRRLKIAANGRDEPLARLGPVIWDIAVVPDESAAYAAVADRADNGRDLGVVRILLDGSGSVEPIMPPAALEATTDVRRVAERAFQIDLGISSDARYLVRRTCHAGGCVVQIADLVTGRVVDLGDREVYGVVADVIVARRCDAPACRLEAVDIETGDARSADVDVFGPVAEINGVAVVVPILDDGNGVITLQAVDPASGQSRVLYRPPEGTELITSDFFTVKVEVPDGFFYVIEITPVEIDGAVIRRDERHLLIPLAEGEVIEIPRPAYIQPAGFGTPG